MGQTSLTSRERRVLERLLPLVSRRAEEEQANEARLRSTLASAEKAADDRARAAEKAYLAEERDADATMTRESDGHREAFDVEHAAARAAMDAELAAFAERTQSIEGSARQDLEDSAWLAETVVESSERKLKQEFTQIAQQLAAYTGEVEQVRREAQTLLARQRLAPLEEVPPGDDANPPNAEGIRARCDSARVGALLRLAILARRVRPPLLRPSSLLIASLTMGVGGAIVGAWAIGPATAPAAALGAAGGLLATAIIAGVVWAWSRRNIPEATRALARSIADAAALGARWLEHAEGERDRQAGVIRAKRDGEIRKAKDRYAAVKHELAQRKREEEPAIRQRHEGIIGAIRKRFDSRLRTADEARRQRIDRARALRDTIVQQAIATRDEASAGARSAHALARASLAKEWASGVQEAAGEHGAITSVVDRLCPAWSDEYVTSLRPSNVVPPAVRFGEVAVDLASIAGPLPVDHATTSALPEGPVLRLPALIDLEEKGSILIQTGPEGREQAVRTIENILLRLLTTFPPGKARFTIIDPVGLGQSFAGFMHLADYEEAIVGDKIWTDAKRIEQRLADLTEHMENVIQKYLRNEFATIQDYNRFAGEVAEPFRFLVIADFPAQLSEVAAKHLASIVSSGPRCGVYTLIVADAKTRPPAFIPVAEVERASNVLSWRQGRFVHADEAFARWPLSLDAPPADAAFTKLIHTIGRYAKDSNRVQVPFDTVMPPVGQRWSADASDELRIPIGRAGATRLQYLALGRGTAQHMLVAGRTGSGKSTLLHAIVTNLALWYTPDQVEFYLVDFKKGVEFKTYATHQVPHARVVAVESEREFGLSVLRKLDAELTRRGQLFRDSGVQDLAGYRRYARGPGAGLVPTHMPRSLLIVDEFQEFFVEDDKIAQEVSLLLDRLVRQGRAFGMHVILGSQTVGGAYSLARSTIGQMGVRVALQCSEADSYLIMAEDNNAPRLLSRPGEAIYNDASGMVEGNSPFQVVWLSEEKRDECLDEVGGLAGSMLATRPLPPIVFEGNVPAELARNEALDAMLAGRAAIAPGTTPRAWLGEAISIKDPTSVPFRRQSGSNVLVVGQQETSAAAMQVAAILALAAHARATREEGVRFSILDAGGSESPSADAFAALARALPGIVRVAGVPEAAAIVGDIASELEQRRTGGSGGGEGPRHYVFVHGLQRFRALRKSEEDFGFGESDAATRPDQQFSKLLREGPPLGMHLLVWCDTVGNLERALDRRALREFDYRVPFQMSSNDSTALIDSPLAVNLGQYRAMLFSEELGQVEKFRPYAMPSAEWLSRALAGLAHSPPPGRRN